MTSKGPVATGPRQAAENPDPIDCSGVSCMPSPSSFPHRSLHSRARGHQQHVDSSSQPSESRGAAQIALGNGVKASEAHRSKLFLAQNRHIWLVPFRMTVGAAPAQRPRTRPSSFAMVMAACTGPCMEAPFKVEHAEQVHQSAGHEDRMGWRAALPTSRRPTQTMPHLVFESLLGHAMLLLKPDFDHLKGCDDHQSLCDACAEACQHAVRLRQVAVLHQH